MYFSLYADAPAGQLDFQASDFGGKARVIHSVPTNGQTLIHLAIQSCNILDCIGKRAQTESKSWMWMINRDDLSPEQVCRLCCQVAFDPEATSFKLTRDVSLYIMRFRAERPHDDLERVAVEVSRSYHANAEKWGKIHEQ